MIDLSGFGGDFRSMWGRLVRLPLRLLPQGSMVRILQGPLRGKRWIVGSSDHGCWLGWYERTKQELFTKVTLPGHTVYDIGAHVGFYTLLSSLLVGQRGMVFAFEPLPINIELLKQHLTLNSVSNVTVLECAVGRHDGTANFQSHASRSQGRLNDQGNFQVKVVSLDNLVFHQDLPAPDIIKMDIEGGSSMRFVGQLA